MIGGVILKSKGFKVFIAVIMVGLILFANNRQTQAPKKGNQTLSLKSALQDPLEQFVSIVFLGDSITWGMTTTGNIPDFNTNRDGTLSDIRDRFESESFVNKFKRYIGSTYMSDAKRHVSNWTASPRGESIVEYHKEFVLSPNEKNLDVSTEGKVDGRIVKSNQSLSKKQVVFHIDSLSDGQGMIKFKFTGKEFTLSYDSEPNSMDYELLINGESQGIYSTKAGADNNLVTFDNRRRHQFEYVRDAVVEIQTIPKKDRGLQTLKIGGILIDKTVKISNQAIIGATTKSYLTNNLEGNTKGDGMAIQNEDQYVFMQLGTNDRKITKSTTKGSAEYKKNLQKIVDAVKPNRELILMCPPPAQKENPKVYSFNTKEVCNIITQVAEENRIPLIDNYSIFSGMEKSTYLADGLHPNDSGHQMIYQNIVEGLK